MAQGEMQSDMIRTGELRVGVGKVLADGLWAADVDYTICATAGGEHSSCAWLSLLRGHIATDVAATAERNWVLVAPTGLHYQLLGNRSVDKQGRYVVDVALVQ